MKAVIRYFSAAVLAAALCVGMGFLYHHVRQVASGSVCSRLEISFADSLRFVREQDIREYLDSRYGPCIGERLDSIRLASIEDMLESRSAVMRAEAWTTRDGTLHIDITQRAPVLRFQGDESGFYVDEHGYIFPLHPSYTAPVPVIEGAIPVSVPAGFKGKAPDEGGRAWIAGVLEMNRYISASRTWRRNIEHIRVRPGGDLLLSLTGRDELFLVGQPEDIPDKLMRMDRYIGVIAPSKPEGYYKTIIVKYNKQIICRQKDT
jgi:hypothetical protein